MLVVTVYNNLTLIFAPGLDSGDWTVLHVSFTLKLDPCLAIASCTVDCSVASVTLG